MDFLKRQYAKAQIDMAIVKKVRKLNLSSNALNEFPERLCECRRLRELFLQKNLLTQIPVNISTDLRNIHTLTLANNKLSTFPIAILNLHQLRNLNISHNPIKTIPSHIKRLKYLEVFWCNHTELTELPSEIGKLKNLDTFGARGNQIVRLPSSIGYLNKLRWLTLENNCITRLPFSFALLKNLIHLNLRQNYLDRLPSQLYLLRRLKFCWLNDNYIEVITRQDINETYFMRMLNVHGNPLDKIGSIFLDLNSHIFWEKDTHKLSDDDYDGSGEFDVVWMHSVSTSSLDVDSDDWQVHQSTILKSTVNTSKFLCTN